MSGALLLAAMAALSAAPAVPAEGSTPAAPSRIAVIDVELTSAAAKALDAAALTEVFSGALQDPDARLLTARDVATALGFERTRQLLGCSDDTCLTEIVGALGAEFIAQASVGSVERSYVVSARLIDSRSGTAIARQAETVTSAEELPSALTRIGRALIVGWRRHTGRAERPGLASGGGSSLRVGGYLLGVADPRARIVGGEVGLSLRRGAWGVGVGVTLASHPSLRLSGSYLLRTPLASLDVALSVRGLVNPLFPGGPVLGGGVGVGPQWQVLPWLTASATAAAELYGTPVGVRWAPLVSAGVAFHL